MKRFGLIHLLLLILPAAALGAGQKSSARNRHAETPRPALEWRITGPNGGDVRSLEIDPNDPQRLYFGTLDGQIYTSADGGQQWSRLTSFDRPGLYIDHLIIDPRDSQTIYAAAHRHKQPGGFFKTVDGGETWREAKELQNEAVHSLAQSPSNPDILVAGTSRGIFRSDDSGESWKQLDTSAYPDLINIESLAIDPRNPNIIYAGTWHLPWKTNDGGKTWRSIKDGMIDDSDVFAIAIDPRNPDHVIASACSGIYESRNAGASWRKVDGIPSTSRRTRSILQHPSMPDYVFAGTTEGFWRSTTGGDSWRVTTSRRLEVNAIQVHPKNPEVVYIGTNNYGVMVSRDGGKSFTPTNDGFSGRLAYSILPDRERPGRIYAATINTTTGGGFFFVSDDGGTTWQPSMRNMPNRLLAKSILQDRRDGNILYLGTNLGVYRSLDRGASWAPVHLGEEEPVDSDRAPRRELGTEEASKAETKRIMQRAITPPETIRLAQEALAAAGYDPGKPDGRMGPRTAAALKKFQTDRNLSPTGELDPATITALNIKGLVPLTEMVNALAHTYDERDGAPGIFAATGSGLYRSYDPERGWERIEYGAGYDARTMCVFVSERDPKMIWVGTATSGVLVSHDGGATWQQVKGVPATAPISSIAQNPKRPDYIYVGSTQMLYVSRDGGETWLPRGNELPLGNYTSILINPENSDEVFVGNAYERGGGVFRSTDGGLTWQRMDAQLPSRRVWALASDTSDLKRIFVGSHSAGIYVASRPAGVAVSANDGK